MHISSDIAISDTKLLSMRQRIYHQGDILIVADIIPPDVERIQPIENQVVLADSKHTFAAIDRVSHFQHSNTGIQYICVENRMARLMHQKHETITIPTGTYRVIHNSLNHKQ